MRKKKKKGPGGINTQSHTTKDSNTGLPDVTAYCALSTGMPLGKQTIIHMTGRKQK